MTFSWSFIGRHWRGEYSLHEAVLVAAFLVQGSMSGLGLVVMLITQDWVDPRAQLAPQLTVILLSFPIEIWGWIGLYRTARRRRREGAGLWAWVAQSASIVGLVGVSTGGAVVASASAIILTMVMDGQGLKPATLEWKGNELVLKGDIAWSVADDLKDKIRGRRGFNLRVTSNGGSLGAALVMADRLREHQLHELIIDRDCSSACTALFEATPRRIALPGASISTHAPMVVEGVEKMAEEASKKQVASYRRAGIQERWIDRTLKTPNNRFYKASLPELFSQRVISHYRTPEGDYDEVAWTNTYRKIDAAYWDNVVQSEVR